MAITSGCRDVEHLLYRSRADIAVHQAVPGWAGEGPSTRLVTVDQTALTIVRPGRRYFWTCSSSRQSNCVGSMPCSDKKRSILAFSQPSLSLD
jgi:hypothetical protein